MYCFIIIILERTKQVTLIELKWETIGLVREMKIF